MTTTQGLSLYDRLGGAAAIHAASQGLVDRIAADPELAPYFRGVALDRHILQLATFVGALAGGPYTYRGPDMGAAHGRLGVTSVHFARVAQHLAATLAELEVSAAAADELVAIVATLHDAVVTRA